MIVPHNKPDREVVLRFEGSFGIREALELPAMVAQVLDGDVVLDFRRVRKLEPGAAVVLIPAMASLCSRRVRTEGLGDIDVESGGSVSPPETWLG